MTDFNALQALEKSTRVLEPDRATAAEWFQKAEHFALDFAEAIETKNAFDADFTKSEAIESIDLEKKVSLDKALAEIDDYVFQGGLEPASGGHIGYIPGGGIVAAAMGDLIAAVSNKYAGMFYGSPGTVRLENKLVRWFCDKVGYDTRSSGVLLSGGSLSNLTGIVAGRDAKKALALGVKGVIYLTGQTHHCMDKAFRISGLANQTFRYVAMDDRFRMDPVALKNQIEEDIAAGLTPWLIVANAGSTDTGAIDPIAEIASISDTHNMWLHVDGAYGGLFCLLEEYATELGSLHFADSLVLDPHKTLFLPYGLGVALVKNASHLKNSFGFEANYMQDAQNQGFQTSPAELGPELTKHFRGLRMWLPLRMFGIEPFIDGLKEKRLLTLYFQEEINKRGFHTPYTPQLTVLLFRKNTGDNEQDNVTNKEILDKLLADGRVFISSTTVDGLFYLRIAVLSFRTHRHTMDVLLDMIDKAC